MLQEFSLTQSGYIPLYCICLVVEKNSPLYSLILAFGDINIFSIIATSPLGIDKEAISEFQ
jgi:hypothetical protein